MVFWGLVGDFFGEPTQVENLSQDPINHAHKLNPTIYKPHIVTYYF